MGFGDIEMPGQNFNLEGYEQWEYHTEFIEADAKAQAEYLRQKFAGQTFPKYSVQAVLPRLNELGGQGWELIHMEPVLLGSNADVHFMGGDIGAYSRQYLVVLKRKRRG